MDDYAQHAGEKAGPVRRALHADGVVRDVFDGNWMLLPMMLLLFLHA